MAVTFQQVEALEAEGRRLVPVILADGSDALESRDRFLALCIPVLDDEIRRTSYGYCRYRVRGADGSWRGEVECESFYDPLFTYLWDRKFSGDTLPRFLGSFAELDAPATGDGGQPRLTNWLRRSIRNACIDWFRSPVRVDGRSTGISQAELMRLESSREELSGTRYQDEGVPLTLKPGAKTAMPEAWDHALSGDGTGVEDLHTRLEKALAQLKPRTRAALYLYYCVALVLPGDVAAAIAAWRKVPDEVVQAEAEALRAPLVERFNAGIVDSDEEILAAQRLRLRDALRKIDDLERAAAALKVSHEELDRWSLEARDLSVREIQEAARTEPGESRSRLRCEYQKACRVILRTKRKISSLEARRSVFPTPTYAQIGKILGLKEAGATAQVHRGRRQLEKLLAAEGPQRKG